MDNLAEVHWFLNCVYLFFFLTQGIPKVEPNSDLQHTVEVGNIIKYMSKQLMLDKVANCLYSTF